MSTSPDTASATSDVPLLIEASCEECDHLRSTAQLAHVERPAVLVEMQAGRDGKPWYLCIPHWFDGLHPNDPSRIGARVLEVDPALAPAPLPVAPTGPTKEVSHARKKASRSKIKA